MAADKVTRDDIIGDVLEQFPQAAAFFLEIGMHCLGCPSARGETIAEACAAHDADCEALLRRVNAGI